MSLKQSSRDKRWEIKWEEFEYEYEFGIHTRDACTVLQPPRFLDCLGVPNLWDAN